MRGEGATVVLLFQLDGYNCRTLQTQGGEEGGREGRQGEDRGVRKGRKEGGREMERRGVGGEERDGRRRDNEGGREGEGK